MNIQYKARQDSSPQLILALVDGGGGKGKVTGSVCLGVLLIGTDRDSELANNKTLAYWEERQRKRRR